MNCQILVSPSMILLLRRRRTRLKIKTKPSRHSLFYVSHKDRKEIAQDLKLIYQAPTLDEADFQLGKFADKWNAVYPVAVKSWRSNWARVIPMFSFAPEIRRAIYTTNRIIVEFITRIIFRIAVSVPSKASIRQFSLNRIVLF